MKTNIAIDLEKNTVIVSNTFYKKASMALPNTMNCVRQ